MNPQGTRFSCSSLVHPVSLELPRLWVLLIDLTFQHLPKVRLERAKNQLSNQQLLETSSKTAPNWKKNGTSWMYLYCPIPWCWDATTSSFSVKSQVSPRQTFKKHHPLFHVSGCLTSAELALEQECKRLRAPRLVQSPVEMSPGNAIRCLEQIHLNETVILLWLVDRESYL